MHFTDSFINRALHHLSRIFSRMIFALVIVMAPYKSLQSLKLFLIRRMGVRVGKQTYFSENFFVLRGTNTTLGDNSNFGRNFSLHDIGTIEIGDGALVSHQVTLIAGNHDLDQRRTSYIAPISIGMNAWIGVGVTILGPCSIGDNVIVGAHSFVTGTFPSNVVIAGTPARIIKTLSQQ